MIPIRRKHLLKVVGIVFFVMLALWLFGAYLVEKNSQLVLEKIIEKVDSKIKGKVSVGAWKVSFFKSFPNMSVSFENVVLRDSLWKTHRHDLLNARNIDLRLGLFPLIKGRISIEKISFNQMKIFVYTDTAGYSNLDMLKTGKRETKKPEDDTRMTNPFKVKHLEFKHAVFILNDQKRHKFFNIDIDKLAAEINHTPEGWNGDFKLISHVHDFAFSTRKGSFIKDKIVQGRITAHYNNEAGLIAFDRKPLKIGRDVFHIAAEIALRTKIPHFTIDITGKQLLYKDMAPLLAPNIRKKTAMFDVQKPIDVVATIMNDGTIVNSDPSIRVKITVLNNVIKTPFVTLTDCSFIGFFDNRDTLKRKTGDPNSIFRFNNISAKCYNIPILMDSLRIRNLKKPVLTANLAADFPLQKLNRSFGDLFDFHKGSVNLRLSARTDMKALELHKPVFYGKIYIRNADLTYKPRRIRLVNSSLNLDFNQQGLCISDSKFQLGENVVNLDVQVKNFLNLFYSDPEKLIADIRLRSPLINLKDLVPVFASRQQTSTPGSDTHTFEDFTDQLAVAMEKSTIRLTVDVAKAVYDKFEARDLDASIYMVGTDIFLKNVGVKHADGSLSLQGAIRERGNRKSHVTLRSVIRRVNIPKFLYAFNNFGQETITNNNIRGLLSANLNLEGDISEEGTIIKNSLQGKLNFSLDKGALVGLTPLEKISKYVFKSRNLSNVQLQPLQGTFSLRGDKIDISPMQINSTVLNFDIAGVFGFHAGTNITLDIPLRDPGKSLGIRDPEKRNQERMKGLVLHLRYFDDNGKPRIRWNDEAGKNKLWN